MPTRPEFDDPVMPFAEPRPAPPMPAPGDGRAYDTPPRTDDKSSPERTGEVEAPASKAAPKTTARRAS